MKSNLKLEQIWQATAGMKSLVDAKIARGPNESPAKPGPDWSATAAKLAAKAQKLAKKRQK